MTEAYTSLDNILRFYGNSTHNGSHIPFNFELISYTNGQSNASVFKQHIDEWMAKKPADKVANWVVGTIAFISIRESL